MTFIKAGCYVLLLNTKQYSCEEEEVAESPLIGFGFLEELGIKLSIKKEGLNFNITPVREPA